MFKIHLNHGSFMGVNTVNKNLTLMHRRDYTFTASIEAHQIRKQFRMFCVRGNQTGNISLLIHKSLVKFFSFMEVTFLFIIIIIFTYYKNTKTSRPKKKGTV